nr:TetR/AcrR family transcriptional regulator [Kineosporia rhizophila]
MEAAYQYVLGHGLADMSLRPLAEALGSSPRVLLFLFESKEGLIRALLERAQQDEVSLLQDFGVEAARPPGLAAAVGQLWQWLSDPQHEPLLRLWAESYVRSLVEPDGPWAGFAQQTVAQWLAFLERCQDEPAGANSLASRSLALAALRGSVLDLLATGDRERTSAAIDLLVKNLR